MLLLQSTTDYAHSTNLHKLKTPLHKISTISHKSSSFIGSPVVAAILPEFDQDELSKATAIIVGNRPRITKRLEEEKRESLEVSLHP